MQLKFKIIGVFLVSIAISVMVFFYTTAYLIEHVAWQGMDLTAMQKAVDEAVITIKQQTQVEELEDNQLQEIIERVAQNYEGTIIEIIRKDESWHLTTAAKQQITTIKKLVESLSQHGKYQQEQWTVAKEVSSQSGKAMYVVCIVPQENFRLLSWQINGQAGIYVVRTIVIVGFIITLTISTFCAFLFSKNMLKRFNHLYYGMSQFGLGNTEVTLQDGQKDEIGELVHTFNKMAYKIRQQVAIQKEEESKRRELISNISHDLRTPLSSIVGYTESLRDGIYDDEEEQKKYLEIIYKKALYTEKLLGELLDFSGLECNTFSINKEEVDLAELTREILIEYLPIVEEKNVELIIAIEEGIVSARIDKNKIARVIRNLMDNAIKYGSQGKQIKVGVKAYKEQIELIVADKGQGIAKEELEYIFKRFYRVNKGRSTKDGGMGLGLAIVDEIIKKHEGGIEVKSEVGQGTSIIVRLPR